QTSKPTGQASIGLPPVAKLTVEGIVIFISFGITIYYLLKALGI
ncbi:uncharacterized protein METZ01_LOCUS265755, partial [marine metagenome]